jgi:hypothetical protein
MDLSSIIELREELDKKKYQLKESDIKRGKTKTREEGRVTKGSSKDDGLKESMSKLIEKSKIYEQLARGERPLREPDLVDFSRIDDYASLSEELIEIKDEFGRTRMMPREQANTSVNLIGINSTSDDLEQNFYDSSKEIRTKGIGFMDLGKDWKTRKDRLEALKKLRMETVDSRQKSEILKEEKRLSKEKRLLIIAERLARKQNP